MADAGTAHKPTMTMTGHMALSVFERYNIVSESDFFTAAAQLDAFARRSTSNERVAR